ncbi:cupin domain-containing protein [Alteraurantiacibacter buctensis]|uniref:Cupin domain-containing protein n=1 Tax=Alteraurantiacibacter buctensis TaxID=1503981 RepID=A0A844Z042_9SPHN|nr:cupin domain-containing protein [Alteraurantiacibacter buctensis]MXO72842.1 cupin domain-containing protein [Alteraurantiacibacter buctensis]
MSSQSAPLDELYASFASLNMEGGWHRRFPALWSEPRKNFLPHIWHYAAVKPILARAGELIDTALAERRNLTMFNPVEGNVYATVRTIVAAYQMVRPGEFARAHRHTPNALRLILEGTGTFTVVDGKEVEMRPGDVLLTPNWAWHSHENKGCDDCYWMDFLDVPLVHLLEPMFYQPHPDGRESDVVPLAEAPIAFRADDIATRLAAATPDAAGVRQVTLGPATLATLALDVVQLPASAMFAPPRETANAVYAVMRGDGALIVEDDRTAWSFGDTIAMPAWREFALQAGAGGALLLKVSDRALLEKLGWYRTSADLAE